MYVVGHNNECIQFNQREMARDILPTTPGDLARLVQPHFTVHHMAEQAFPFPHARRHETRPRFGVILPIEADGSAMVFVRVVRHLSLARLGALIGEL